MYKRKFLVTHRLARRQRRRKYLECTENELVEVSLLHAGCGMTTPAHAQQLAKAAIKTGATGEALGIFCSLDSGNHGNLHRDALKWLSNCGLEVEPYILHLPLDLKRPNEEGDTSAELKGIACLPIHEMVHAL